MDVTALKNMGAVQDNEWTAGQRVTGIHPRVHRMLRKRRLSNARKVSVRFRSLQFNRTVRCRRDVIYRLLSQSLVVAKSKKSVNICMGMTRTQTDAPVGHEDGGEQAPHIQQHANPA